MDSWEHETLMKITSGKSWTRWSRSRCSLGPIWHLKIVKRTLSVHFWPGTPELPKRLDKGECFAPFRLHDTTPCSKLAPSFQTWIRSAKAERGCEALFRPTKVSARKTCRDGWPFQVPRKLTAKTQRCQLCREHKEEHRFEHEHKQQHEHQHEHEQAHEHELVTPSAWRREGCEALPKMKCWKIVNLTNFAIEHTKTHQKITLNSNRIMLKPVRNELTSKSRKS